MSIKRIVFFLGGIALVLLSLSAGAEMRFWHDRAGNEFQGEYSKEVFGNIYLRGTDGHVFPVAATNLIDGDIAYIRSLSPPKIQIKFSKKLREITDYPEDYSPETWDDHEIEVTGLVTVRKMGHQPYTGALRGELYLIGKEVDPSSSPFRLFAKKGFAISFPGETSEFQCQLTQTLRYYSMNGELDRGAHYQGYVVVVDDSAGNRLAFDTNLSWLKEDEVAALRKVPCPGFLDEDCNKRPVPRPKSYRESDSGSY
jgi:hypothetical protein